MVVFFHCSLCCAKACQFDWVLSLFLLLLLLPLETDVEKNHFYCWCQSMFCLSSLLAIWGDLSYAYIVKWFWVYFCTWCEGVFQFHWFTRSCPVLSASLSEKTVLFPFYILASFVKDWLNAGLWVYSWVLHVVLLVYMSVLVALPQCLVYCGSEKLPDVWESYSSYFIFPLSVPLRIWVIYGSI